MDAMIASQTYTSRPAVEIKLQNTIGETRKRAHQLVSSD
jgi:hypothetical protein